MAGVNINRIFGELKMHFKLNLNWVDVEELLNIEEGCSSTESNERAQKFWELPMCSQEHGSQDHQLQALRELAGTINSMRVDNQGSYDNTYDNWANIIPVVPPEAYLSYIYTIASLPMLPDHVLQASKSVNEHTNVQLALNAASTYFLTLTIPGAKAYNIFDDDVIEHCLKLFKLLEQNPNGGVQANTIWINFLTICDYLKLVFRYVHFKDNLTTRDKIIRCLMEILYMNLKQGQVNSCAPVLYGKCFELFDEIVNEHNGDVYDTLHLILRQTFPMHIYEEGGRRGGHGKHISDWFIALISKYPEILERILHLYIECVVSNPLKSWKANEEKVAIAYAAKYDAALYAKCNKSCVDYVVEAVKADDAVTIQTRALDLIDRLLQKQTEVEWSIFRYDVTKVPREVTLIKEVILCLNDRTFTVRRKAAQVLISALKQGSAMTTKILEECIRFVQYDNSDVEAPPEPTAGEHELHFEKPGVMQYAYSFEGHELLELEISHLPNLIYERFFASDNGLSRTVGLALIERLILINPLIIYNTNFVRECSLLAADRLSSVRKAALETVENLLQKYCNCFSLVCVYCRIWSCLLSDEEIPLQKLAIQSFNQNVLRNIQPLESSNDPKHFMPWRIISTLLMTQPRTYLQERLTILLETDSAVTPKLVQTIISHLSTSTATEAWALLLLISTRITNNMDALVIHFKNLSSYNMKDNQLLALQLIICCLPNFSKSAQNTLYKLLMEHLRTGSIWLGLISPAINLLNQMHKLSASQSPLDSENDNTWLNPLLQEVNESILLCAENFQEEHTRLQCLLGTYTELIVMLPQEVDERIVRIVFKYLRECTKLTEENFDTDNERMMNWMIVMGGRLCLRDNDLANRLAALYRLILNNNDRPQIINTTLIALNDLGKKHSMILESNFMHILAKLNSKFVMTRVGTFRCVKDVILSGSIKLRGPILTSLLAGIVDESSEMAREADAFFIRYMRLFNQHLFHHCLKMCPFDFNDHGYLKDAHNYPSYQSPLKGEHKRTSRRLLYNHIMSTLDDNTLLLYFGQLKLLAEKTKDIAFISSPNALDVVEDVLFMMRRICFLTKGKKQLGARPDGENESKDDEADAPTDMPAPTDPTSSSTDTAKSGKGRGRGGRQQEDPLKQLERCLRYVEESHRNLKNIVSKQLQHAYDKLCLALAMRFPNYIDFAQPAQFWEKYRNSKPTGKRKRQRPAEDPNETDELSPAGDSDSDNELPLERHKLHYSARPKIRKRNCDMILTELIFQPPDW